MKNSTAKKVTLAGLFAAIIFIGTFISIKIPNGQGYVNFGDGFIMAAAAFLGPVAIPAAAIGSMLTDIVLGYAVYAPATFVIKALVAVVSWCFIKLAEGKKGGFAIAVLGFVLAEAVMVGGYFVYEIFLYGVAGASASVPFNCIQGVFGVIIGSILYPVMKKIKGKFDK